VLTNARRIHISVLQRVTNCLEFQPVVAIGCTFAAFLAEANLGDRDPEILLRSALRFFTFLSEEQPQSEVSRIVVNRFEAGSFLGENFQVQGGS